MPESPAHTQPSLSHPLPASGDPLDLLASWPAGRPLVASLPHPPADHGRDVTDDLAHADPVPALAVLAEPSGVWRAIADGRGGWTAHHHGTLPPLPSQKPKTTATPEVFSADVFSAIDGLLHATATPIEPNAHTAAFPSGWLAVLAYPLGTQAEPTAGPPPAKSTLLAEMHRLEHAHVIDRRSGERWTIGTPPTPTTPSTLTHASATPALELSLDTAGERYMAAVARIVDYLRAGDVFQVNLAHRLSAELQAGASPRSLYSALARAAQPRHGMHVESPSGTQLLGLSPERFLAMAPAQIGEPRRVWTRPMKGTRPAADPAGRGALDQSSKDRAELAMIVDLMRNDLGRVCEPGTMRVDEQRTIETHAAGTPAGVLQGVATVSGELRASQTIGDLLRATFPPGSVTGAPKVRAMQIIDELEAHPRSIYTGAMGLISDTGLMDLAVTIRTAVVEPTNITDGANDGLRLTYHAGAGIVVESDPEAELAETLDKSRVIGDARPYRTARRGTTLQ